MKLKHCLQRFWDALTGPRGSFRPKNGLVRKDSQAVSWEVPPIVDFDLQSRGLGLV